MRECGTRMGAPVSRLVFAQIVRPVMVHALTCLCCLCAMIGSSWGSGRKRRGWGDGMIPNFVCGGSTLLCILVSSWSSIIKSFPLICIYIVITWRLAKKDGPRPAGTQKSTCQHHCMKAAPDITLRYGRCKQSAPSRGLRLGIDYY